MRIGGIGENPAHHLQISLALSGGGYRAMLFHLGALIRLNELGILHQITLISSVSGGSILAGLLALTWPDLRFNADGVAENFETLVVEPLIGLAQKSIASKIQILLWLLTGQGGNQIPHAYEKLLDSRLKTRIRDLAIRKNNAGDGHYPTIIFNAINFQTGARWQFNVRDAKMGDEVYGFYTDHDATLSEAIAASGAFPPFLSPLKLNPSGRYKPPHDLKAHQLPSDLRKWRILLGDGGIQDNLGIDSASSRGIILVSDGGKYLNSEFRVGYLLNITRNLKLYIPFQMLRVISLIDHQVRLRRLFELRHAFQMQSISDSHPDPDTRHALRDYSRYGVYWRMNYQDLIVGDLPEILTKNHLIDISQAVDLANTETGLSGLDPDRIHRLINLGYLRCAEKILAFLPDHIVTTSDITLHYVNKNQPAAQYSLASALATSLPSEPHIINAEGVGGILLMAIGAVCAGLGFTGFAWVLQWIGGLIAIACVALGLMLLFRHLKSHRYSSKKDTDAPSAPTPQNPVSTSGIHQT